MGAFLIIVVSAAIAILGACYAPEIRIWIDQRSKDWYARWTKANEVTENEESKDDATFDGK